MSSFFNARSLPLLISACVGFCILNLQFYTGVRFVQFFGMRWLPELMLLQALAFGLFAGVHSLWIRRIRLFADDLRAPIRSASALGVAALALGTFGKDGKTVALSFLLGIWATVLLRRSLNWYVSRKILNFQGGTLLTQVAAAQEVGLLVGAALLPFSQSSTLRTAPFFLLLFLYYFYGKLRFESSEPLKHRKTRELQVAKFGFSSAWVVMIAAVVALKGLSMLGFASTLSRIAYSPREFVTIYAKFASFQAIASLMLLGITARYTTSLATWTSGYRSVFVFHSAAAFIALASGYAHALAPALVWMTAEGIRKTLESSLLTRSQKMLGINLPQNLRLSFERNVESRGGTIGLAAAAMIGIVVFRYRVSPLLLWACTLGIGIGGYLACRKLFERLSSFHVASFQSKNLRESVRTCWFLAHPWARHYSYALEELLEKNPRPIVAKSALHALGFVGSARSAEILVRYARSQREDIQMVAIEACLRNRVKGLEKLLHELLEREAKSHRNVRMQVVEAAASKLGQKALPLLKQIISKDSSSRVVANCVELLGVIAKESRDEQLHNYLVKFLGSKYSRRTRANAVVALYRARAYRTKAENTLAELFRSSDKLDFAAAAFASGRLGLSAWQRVIAEESERRHHASPALLCALLQFGDSHACERLAALLATDPHQTLLHIVDLPQKLRARVYKALIPYGQKAVNEIIDLMPSTERNFELDRNELRQFAEMNPRTA